jgi:hypothetical protein
MRTQGPLHTNGKHYTFRAASTSDMSLINKLNFLRSMKPKTSVSKRLLSMSSKSSVYRLKNGRCKNKEIYYAMRLSMFFSFCWMEQTAFVEKD